jgi:NTE family protein
MEVNGLKIGIALSGGGARGAAHAGALKALEEAGIRPYHITGVSAGAIIGALYCGGNSPDEILDILKIKSLFSLFSFNNIGEGLVDTRYFQNIIKGHVIGDNFADLTTKLSIGAANLNSGSFEIIEQGTLSTIAAASAAVPLLIKPVRIGKDLYADGGILNNLLVEPLLETCDFIIGINVHHHSRMEEIDGMRDIGKRCFEMIAWNSITRNSKKCDFMIEMLRTNQYAMFDFKHSAQLFNIGYEETKNQLIALNEKLENRNKIVAQSLPEKGDDSTLES